MPKHPRGRRCVRGATRSQNAARGRAGGVPATIAATNAHAPSTAGRPLTRTSARQQQQQQQQQPQAQQQAQEEESGGEEENATASHDNASALSVDQLLTLITAQMQGASGHVDAPVSRAAAIATMADAVGSAAAPLQGHACLV